MNLNNIPLCTLRYIENRYRVPASISSALPRGSSMRSIIPTCVHAWRLRVLLRRIAVKWLHSSPWRTQQRQIKLRTVTYQTHNEKYFSQVCITLRILIAKPEFIDIIEGQRATSSLSNARVHFKNFFTIQTKTLSIIFYPSSFPSF